jgi:hypothetical protein
LDFEMNFAPDKVNFRRNTGGISRKFNAVWRHRTAGQRTLEKF